MKNLAHVTKEEQLEFVSSFDHILSDVDGVLWLQLHEIPGATDALDTLKKIGKTVRFVSNNSMTSYEMYLKRLEKVCGCEQDLIVPTLAVIDYLKSIDFQKEAFVIGTSFYKQQLRDAGIKVAKDMPDRIGDTLKDLLEVSDIDPNVGAVIADMELNVNYVKLHKAMMYLKKPDVIFIKGASDTKVPISSNVNLIGPGYFHQALEDLCERKANCLAKPSIELNKFIMKKYQINDPSRVLFMGDSIPEDMGFATNCGYHKLLFMTGITDKQHLEHWNYPEEYKPKYYVDCLKSFAEIVENCLL